MTHTITIRTGRERLQYSLTFELLLLCLLMSLGGLVFQRPFFEMGLLAIILLVKAIVINLLYNWAFDLMDVKAGRVPTKRTWGWRVLHAAGFELGLALTSLPIFMLWLGLPFKVALVLNVAIIGFALTYTFIFNWVYDWLFPVAQPPAPQLSAPQPLRSASGV